MHRKVFFRMLKMSYYFSHIVVDICLLKVDGLWNILFHSINAIILMAPSMSDIKFLLVLLRYKTFVRNFFWKVTFFRNIHFVFFTIFLKTGLFCKVHCYFLHVICSFIAWPKLFFSHTNIIRSCSLVMYPWR